MVVQYLDLLPAPPRWEECLSTVRYAAARAGLNYRLYTSLPEGIYGIGTTGARAADIFRFYHMAAHPGDIYLDADIHARSIFFPLPGAPYFAAQPSYTGGAVHADVWAIQGNGCGEFFDELLKFLIANSKTATGAWEMWSRAAWRWLNTLQPKGTPLGLIPAGHYEHRAFGTWKPARAGTTAEATAEATI